nr:MAG TPA: hypothetical protein [Caudoviricetes sp.]
MRIALTHGSLAISSNKLLLGLNDYFRQIYN